MFKSHARVSLVIVIAIILVYPALVLADDNSASLDTFLVSTVSELYDAVYDKNGLPRDNADIILDVGSYVLTPSAPFGGRLVLGKNTILRSSLDMAEGANGSPMTDASFGPVVLVDGATIVGSSLMPSPFGEGIIVVGKRGIVEKLRLIGGLRPGIDITSRGTIREVFSSGHSIGMGIRAGDEETNGLVEKSLATGNAIIGLRVIAPDPGVSEPSDDVEVRGRIYQNTSMNNGVVNFLIVGGLGTDNNELEVKASQNTFSTGALFANVRIIGGFDVQVEGGANNNEALVKLIDNIFTNGNVGLLVEGGTLNTGILSDPSLSLEERQSSVNEVNVKLSNNTFENNATDIVVYGSRSNSGEPGGSNNRAIITVRGLTTGLITDVFDCFPEAVFPSCTSKAKIRFNPSDDNNDSDSDSE